MPQPLANGLVHDIMPEDYIPETQHDPSAVPPPQQHSHRRRRRKRRSIAEAHSRDKRIKRKVGPPSKLWWLAPIIIGAGGGYFFYTTGFFDTRSNTLGEEARQAAYSESGAEAVKRLRKARGFREAKLPDKALPILNELLNEDPELSGLAFELAHVNYELGNMDDSREFALLALKRNENIAVSNYLIGVTYCLNSQFRDALPYFEAAYKNYDQSAPLLQNWADALRAVGKPNLAIDKLERALGQRPGSKILQMKIALTRIDSGEAGAVRKEAERDLRWTPEYVPALLILAATNLHEENIEDAQKYLEKIRDVAGPMQLKNYLQDVYFMRFQDIEPLQEYFPSRDERLQLAEQNQKAMTEAPKQSPAPAKAGPGTDKDGNTSIPKVDVEDSNLSYPVN